MYPSAVRPSRNLTRTFRGPRSSAWRPTRAKSQGSSCLKFPQWIERTVSLRQGFGVWSTHWLYALREAVEDNVYLRSGINPDDWEFTDVDAVVANTEEPIFCSLVELRRHAEAARRARCHATALGRCARCSQRQTRVRRDCSADCRDGSSGRVRPRRSHSRPRAMGAYRRANGQRGELQSSGRRGDDQRPSQRRGIRAPELRGATRGRLLERCRASPRPSRTCTLSRKRKRFFCGAKSARLRQSWYPRILPSRHRFSRMSRSRCLCAKRWRTWAFQRLGWVIGREESLDGAWVRLTLLQWDSALDTPLRARG